jgi:hypothetical protein
MLRSEREVAAWNRRIIRTIDESAVFASPAKSRETDE